MSNNLVKNPETSEEHKSEKDSSVNLDVALFFSKLKTGVWLLGIPAWVLGIADKSLDAFADGYLSSLEVFHVLTNSLFFLSWLYLKPEIKDNQFHVNKLGLKKRHMISQEYILPFPYLCQIYHLLNLKHLETVHNFSLNNLKVVNVSYFQPTNIGGIIKFKTILNSPANPLRIWRKPIVEVDLILHTPYTIELSIPVYNNKRIIVIFQAFPLTDKEHQLFIDIYSDLNWPKPLLQIVLHFACCLTLLEDLPYLRNLANKNIERLFKLSKFSNNASLLLFKRFVELYGTSGNSTNLIEDKN
ncbi:hypothetical protein [Umezakia ovalisporum]|jgi:hypothetical protein|uniref:Uncharacterized protein n=2 Tax=Umezakia ovalisporum TaxID=75695 RepID=A0AA43KEI2_9CYAN|nr:hypothetical protein [Umezakia ovalisporum]MBI1242096.1 hypothetical protein [Nostoc sp. RI_552]MDH6056706.1 hypothetical protein [Umezakia ovalisporum FSS-43]MDH6063013.1 hypothetical protein [Umezakia ovalisporum FSS-62]MDH6068662.1 hypothetical protein [Umezakia ovalisporum APH033B]MDH6070112.1 hypothetical protein [Umezakia ovalisporum CobakiLakeA]